MTRLRQISSQGVLVLLVAGAHAGCFHDTSLSSPDGNPGGGGGSGPVVSDAAPIGRDAAPVGIDAGIPNRVDASGSHLKIAFSRGGVNGNFGGHVAADDICQNGADSGTWRAWVSDDSSNAIDRIRSDGPWYTMDGRLAFANKAQLAQTPFSVIEYDQGGHLVAASSYWTGTALGGHATTTNCNNWTTIADGVLGTWGDGRQLQGAATWTATSTPVTCAEAMNLLCIQD